MAIGNLMRFIQENPLTKDDLDEIKQEMKLADFSPDMVAFKMPKTKEGKIVFEYINYHRKVPNIERRILQQEFDKVKEGIFNPKTDKKELRKLLLILAHQGTKEAVSVLEEYQKIADGPLKDWVELALEECRAALNTEPGQMIKVIHKIKGKDET